LSPARPAVDADRRVGGYSLGMRQRLGLASALLGDPEVLILDEPANGLDPAGIARLRDLLRQQAKDGRTILVSSHVLSEVAQTVDQEFLKLRTVRSPLLLLAAAQLVVAAGVSGLFVNGADVNDAEAPCVRSGMPASSRSSPSSWVSSASQASTGTRPSPTPTSVRRSAGG
jgi:ABC-type taurine transport system ATPase subunit